MRAWTIRDSLELYNVAAWGAGFFTVNAAGHVEVRPRGEQGPGIDLLDLFTDLQQRGVRPPLLVRFSDILASRVQGLCGAFGKAIGEYGYGGGYRGVYPIKVNQQRHVVEEIVQYGAAQGVGLEAGSKPELLIALAILDTPGALIICNGYKDRAYIETALLAQRLGRTPIIVVDRFREVDLIVKTSRELGIRPHVGVRARLSTKGAGKWIESTGDRSKFGLTEVEIVEAVERLEAEGMLDRKSVAKPKCSTAWSCCTSTSARRSPPSAPTRTPCRRPAGCSSACIRWGRGHATSTSAAAWAWTTTGRKPTFTRR